MGPSDGRYVLDSKPRRLEDMGNTEHSASASTTDAEVVSVNLPSQHKDGEEKDQHHDKPAKLANVWTTVLKVVFVIIGVITGLLAISLITVSIVTAITTKTYDAEQNSRVAGLVLLAVTAAATVAAVIYLQVATFKKHVNPAYGAAAFILVLAIVQALIGGLAVKVETADEVKLLNYVGDSFKQNRQDVPRAVKLWDFTQTSMSCCGLEGPSDYVNYDDYNAPPNVPISCCPSYDPSRPNAAQERARQQCKNAQQFFARGCKQEVLRLFKVTAESVLSVDVTLIIAELALLLVDLFLFKKLLSQKVSASEDESEQQKA